MASSIKIPTELRLALYTVSLYAVFIYWGYLQEKLTSTPYIVSGKETTRTWTFAFALNFSMAAICAGVAEVADKVMYQEPMKDKKEREAVSPLVFWKAAATSALASPIGYTSLRYLSYPMMILTKASKPVPVIVVGVISYNKKYPWYKYTSVFLLVAGISLFTAYKSSSSSKNASGGSTEDKGLMTLLFGMFLVLVNLALDGFTNNEQDHIFNHYKATPIEMMKYTNLWQAGYLLTYLVVTCCLWGSSSELYRAVDIVVQCPEVKYDMILFCGCASIGQVLLFALVKEFGSLLWVTISVTRQLFTILLSVVVFKHSVNSMQWAAIALVFVGLGLDIVMNYMQKSMSGTARLQKPTEDMGKAKKDDDYRQESPTSVQSPSTLERGALSTSSEDDFSPSTLGMKLRKDVTKTE